MDYFKRFVEWVSKLLEDDDKKGNNKGDKQVEMATDGGMNLIEIEDSMKSSIVNSLKVFKGNDTSGFTLNIYVLDNMIFNSLRLGSDGDRMKGSLEERIWTELGVRFKNIHISNEKPDVIKTLYPVIGKGIKDVFYTIDEIGDYATISVVEGCGSIIGEMMKLSASPNAIYNIGRGKVIRTKNSMLRTNDIAFIDDEKCEEYEKNMHVSRCHAHIQYKQDIGFVLYVDEGGTKINGNRTRILRQTESKPIDLESDTKIFIPLKDGDIIELGKEALLRYCYT